jgi:hypothetical protein
MFCALPPPRVFIPILSATYPISIFSFSVSLLSDIDSVAQNDIQLASGTPQYIDINTHEQQRIEVCRCSQLL